MTEQEKKELVLLTIVNNDGVRFGDIMDSVEITRRELLMALNHFLQEGSITKETIDGITYYF